MKETKLVHRDRTYFRSDDEIAAGKNRPDLAVLGFVVTFGVMFVVASAVILFG